VSELSVRAPVRVAAREAGRNLRWGVVRTVTSANDDVESLERGRARSRTLTIGVVSAAASRGLAVLTPLLVVPVGLEYLGTSAYGAWAVALSVTSMLMFADLGIGSGLMTRLGQVAGHDLRASRSYVTNAYLMVLVVVLLALALLLGSAPLVSWPSLLGVARSERSGVEAILLVTLAAFVVNIAGSLIVRVQYGIGQQGVSNAWQIAGSLTSLAATYAAASLDPGRAGFVAAAAFTPVIVSGLNTVTFFFRSGRGAELRPSLDMRDWSVATELISLGGRFLMVTVLLAVTTQSDLWIVSWTSGLAEVADYSIPYRVFSVIGALALVLTLPLWPLNAEALANGDVAWVRRVTRRMTIATVGVVGGLSAIAALAGPPAVDVWLDGALRQDHTLWLGLALWWFVQCVTGPAFMVQNGAAVLRPQLVGYVLLLVSLPAKWVVGESGGHEWIPWVGAGLYVVLIWPACRVGYVRSLMVVRDVASSEGAPELGGTQIGGELRP
jgi:O-antigen/teichoic acid export membrane protein